MKLFIPPLGTVLRLTAPWVFHLHYERRNESAYPLFDAFKEQAPHYSWRESPEPVECSLPKGTILTVDRIYIRQGSNEFDSVTFRLPKQGDRHAVRFWAKLEDVNGMAVVYAEQDQPWWFGLKDQLVNGSAVMVPADRPKYLREGPMEIRPFTAKTVGELPPAYRYVIADGSRIAFIRPVTPEWVEYRIAEATKARKQFSDPVPWWAKQLRGYVKPDSEHVAGWKNSGGGAHTNAWLIDRIIGYIVPKE
jgi:hypothetical protein